MWTTVAIVSCGLLQTMHYRLHLHTYASVYVCVYKSMCMCMINVYMGKLPRRRVRSLKRGRRRMFITAVSIWSCIYCCTQEFSTRAKPFVPSHSCQATYRKCSEMILSVLSVSAAAGGAAMLCRRAPGLPRTNPVGCSFLGHFV